MMSAMIGRVCMCAAYGKIAANAAKEGDKEEKTDMAAWALEASACTVWCFVENGDAQAVLNVEINRDRLLGEVAYNVALALQSHALDKVYPGGNAGVDNDVVARVTVKTMAFWGMCPVAGPKLKAKGIAVLCNAQMKADLDNRGRKGQRGKKGTKAKGSTAKKGTKAKDSAGKKGQKETKAKDSTAA
ncbi:unnamed protein product [Closterium sp. NIES-65]|nr:unnamed protein product [Closterium sp. NIES-65]